MNERTIVGSLGQRASGSAANIAPSPDQSPSKIRDAFGAIEQLSSDLHQVISHLESRLDTVLTPSSPATTTGAALSKESVRPVASHLYDRMVASQEVLREALDRLHLIRQRIEI